MQAEVGNLLDTSVPVRIFDNLHLATLVEGRGGKIEPSGREEMWSARLD